MDAACTVPKGQGFILDSGSFSYFAAQIAMATMKEIVDEYTFQLIYLCVQNVVGFYEAITSYWVVNVTADLRLWLGTSPAPTLPSLFALFRHFSLLKHENNLVQKALR